MKKVYFTRITGKNILSIGNTPVEINFKSGLNIITGNNKDKEDRQNGAGKSTMSELLHIAVFGSTIRDIKKDLIAHNLNNETAEVVLEFRVESPKGHNDFKIIRSFRPSRVKVYKDGIDKTLDTIPNTNQYICEVLSATIPIFQNCVIMTINDTIPFMGKKTGEKRKFIEDIMNLRVFSDMLSMTRTEYNSKSREFEVEISKFKEIDQSIGKFKASREEVVENQRSREEILNNRIENAESLIKTYKANLESTNEVNVNDDIESYDKLESKLNTVTDGISSIDEILWKANSKIEDFKKYQKDLDDTDAVCVTCNRAFEDHDQEHIDKEYQATEDKIKAIRSALSKQIEKRTTLIGIKNQIEIARSALVQKIKKGAELNELSKSAAYNITVQEDVIKNLRDDLSNNTAQTAVIDGTIDEYEDRLADCEQEVHNIRKKMTLLDDVKFILSEEGVKTFIIRKMLAVFNSTLQYYLKALDSNCTCIFNEYFEEEIINENGKMLSYHNFSGAERKSIDLACLFAFNDIRRLNSDVVYNVNIYDELFDSSFDSKGVELVIDTLQERVDKYSECTYVISHRKEAAARSTGEVIYLEKLNGCTTREPYEAR